MIACCVACALLAIVSLGMWNSAQSYTGWTGSMSRSGDLVMSAPSGLHLSDSGQQMLLIMAVVLLLMAVASIVALVQGNGNYFRIYSDHVEARSGGLIITRFTSRITQISEATANPEGLYPHLSIRRKDGKSYGVLLDKDQLAQSERILNQMIGAAR